MEQVKFIWDEVKWFDFEGLVYADKFTLWLGFLAWQGMPPGDIFYDRSDNSFRVLNLILLHRYLDRIWQGF